jgi:hypothetical protein
VTAAAVVGNAPWGDVVDVEAPPPAKESPNPKKDIVSVPHQFLRVRRETQELDDISLKIISGDNVTTQQYPFFVQPDTHSIGYVCGGSLVAPDVVLTTSHCEREFLGDLM